MSQLSTRHLLGIKELNETDIRLVLETATNFKEVINRPIKKVPSLRDITIANIFFENSTRTRLSFELAEKRLSADVVNFSKNNTHQVIFDAEIISKNEIHLNQLEEALQQILVQYPEVVVKEGAQLNILERRPESLLIRYQFPIKSGEKPTEILVKKALNQAFIDWNYALRQAELL